MRNQNSKIRINKKLTRPPKVIFNKPNRAIFLTGGIGDIFAVESFLTNQERERITTIYYATIKNKEIEELWKALPNYPNLQEHITVWNDFSKFWCFSSMNDYLYYCKKIKIKPQIFFQNTTDLSISIVFGKINRKDIFYNNSSFINHKLTDYPCLPNDYIVVCPYSSDKRLIGRDFDLKDWENCLKYLEDNKKIGVLLNKGNEIVPIHNNIINLSNKTTITECVEILKKSKGYIGIDSSLSVLATKCNFEVLKIKSINPHLYNYINCYYSPNNDFNFVGKNIIF